MQREEKENFEGHCRRRAKRAKLFAKTFVLTYRWASSLNALTIYTFDRVERKGHGMISVLS
jgi:hypothetical protein